MGWDSEAPSHGKCSGRTDTRRGEGIQGPKSSRAVEDPSWVGQPGARWPDAEQREVT